MKKLNLKFSTMVLGVVALLFILASFINLVGISGTLKYFLFYFIFLLSFFGISLWLKRNWICYLPSYFLIFFAPIIIIFAFIFNTPGDSFGIALITILAIVFVILAGISYLLARLFVTYVILNKEINLIKEFVNHTEVIVITIGIITWIGLASNLFRESQDMSIFLIVIILYSILMFLGSVILVLILYAYSLIGKMTSLLSLSIMIVYLPFSLLIHSEKTKFFIILGFSIWLIFGTLLMIGLRKIKSRHKINLNEGSEIND